MESFIRKYTAVPEAFITEFFHISKEDYNPNELVINFEKVQNWLGVSRKNNLKRLLKHGIEDIDYKIVRKKVLNKKSGANYVHQITITPNFFRMISMMSETKRGIQVRMYFLSVETAVHDYHKYIVDALERRIGTLEKNQKPKVKCKGGVIYFFAVISDGKALYKIGRSGDIVKRLIKYGTGAADEIDPLFILEVDDMVEAEGCIKNFLRKFQYRKRKEIYEVAIDVMKQMFMLCKDFSNMIKKQFGKNSSEVKDKIEELVDAPSIDILFRENDEKCDMLVGGCLDEPEIHEAEDDAQFGGNYSRRSYMCTKKYCDLIS